MVSLDVNSSLPIMVNELIPIRFITNVQFSIVKDVVTNRRNGSCYARGNPLRAIPSARSWTTDDLNGWRMTKLRQNNGLPSIVAPFFFDFF